ncbi:MAG TPA: urea ABC transporter permease subunit UrtB [Pirellulales bacterium]|nr:urea ABC transporter permease subunit UrtB [Pirellulales bacterium]
MIGRTTFPTLILASLVAGVLFPPVRASAAGPPVETLIRQLADESPVVRRKAIDAITHSKDVRMIAVLKAFNLGNLYLWKAGGDRVVLCEKTTKDASGKELAPLSDPLTGQPVLKDGKQVVRPIDDLTQMGPSGLERRLVGNAITVLELWDPDPDVQVVAIQRVGNSGKAEFIPALEEVAADAMLSEKTRRNAHESIDVIQLLAANTPKADRIAAAQALGKLRSTRGASILGDQLEHMHQDAADGKTVDLELQQTYEKAVAQIESYQRLVRGLGYVRDGISQGSILILMALGLAITFGVMGVINMAHGELMMIGAFATYAMQQFFVKNLPESMFNWYFVAALPVAFLSAAICGYFVEMLVVRFLYGRALDTMLATWGVSIVLIQAVRAIYGNNIGVNAPTWFRGGFEVIQDLVLPYNRCFIVILCVLCVALIYGLLGYTKIGLRIRATVQNREMAAALGVSTRRVDGYTFALGAGIAGIAGYALTLIGGVTPDMGQNYIVESFLVVVTGGVGELAGTIYAGLGLGVLDKIFEPFTGAVWGQVLILVVVILFIQRRPSGLFPPKGRLADV